MLATSKPPRGKESTAKMCYKTPTNSNGLNISLRLSKNLVNSIGIRTEGNYSSLVHDTDIIPMSPFKVIVCLS